MENMLQYWQYVAIFYSDTLSNHSIGQRVFQAGMGCLGFSLTPLRPDHAFEILRDYSYYDPGLPPQFI